MIFSGWSAGRYPRVWACCDEDFAGVYRDWLIPA